MLTKSLKILFKKFHLYFFAKKREIIAVVNRYCTGIDHCYNRKDCC